MVVIGALHEECYKKNNKHARTAKPMHENCKKKKKIYKRNGCLTLIGDLNI